MRTVLISLALLAFPACTAEDFCSSLRIGTNIQGLKRGQVTAQSDFVFKAMLVPVSSAPFGQGSNLLWDHGPAEEAMCCAVQEQGRKLSWCRPEQLACTDPTLQGVDLYVLGEPFSDESRIPDDATYCFVAVHHDTIIAIWHRFWS